MPEAPTPDESRSASIPVTRRGVLPRLAPALAAAAVAVVLLAMLAGLGSRWGIWHFRTGFSLLRWAVYGGILVALLSLAGIYLTRPGTKRPGLPYVVFALLVSLVVVIVPWRWQMQARSVPPIHDITTDTDDPPQFVAIAPLRADAPNPIEYGGPEVAAQQRQAYPDIRPLLLEVPVDQAFRRALDAAMAMGWEIVDTAPTEGRIEATDRTLWFGFRDDVVIRLTPAGESRTVLDVRSLSRVGGSDVGTNAKRIRAYLDEVR